MLSESPSFVRRILRFMALPYVYFRLINWKECKKSKVAVMFDLFYIFFKLKYFPDNYTPCRLWEKDKKEWVYYYGSSYNSYPRSRLRKDVQTYERQILFNDKFITLQLLHGFNLPMPTTHGIVNPGNHYQADIQNIFKSTGAEKLIIKPILGHAGLGIVLAVKKDDHIRIKTKDIELDLENFILREKSIIQEVISQDDRISKISPKCLNTIRVVTLYTKSKEVLVLSSTMRFGVGNSFVDNWSAGGIAVGVDHQTGKLKGVAYDKRGNAYFEHPITKIRFLDYQIHEWDKILEIAIKVQKTCPFYKLLGMDIAISKNGPVLVEVNANPDLVFQEQTSGPLLKDHRIIEEFAKYDLLINNQQKNLLYS